MNQRLKQEITRSYPVLRRSEKKTADYLLKCGENLKDLTLEKIAEGAGVSQPTVMRFVKALGYQGFKDFRYELAGSEQEEGSRFLYGFPFSERDTIRDVPAKIIGTTIGQIEKTIRSITPDIADGEIGRAHV